MKDRKSSNKKTLVKLTDFYCVEGRVLRGGSKNSSLMNGGNVKICSYGDRYQYDPNKF